MVNRTFFTRVRNLAPADDATELAAKYGISDSELEGIEKAMKALAVGKIRVDGKIDRPHKVVYRYKETGKTRKASRAGIHWRKVG